MDLAKGARKNIILFYLLTFSLSFWFVASNWIYFWTRYMTFGELGWLDATAFAFAILLEIPSGAIADLLGKKKTIQIGMFAGIIGTLLIATATSFWAIFAGWMICQVTYAFYSGAAEALAYDTLVDHGNEGLFEKIISKNHSIELYTIAMSTLIGGFVYEYSYRLPQFLWAGGFILAFVVSFFLTEPKSDTEKFSFKVYFKQLYLGSKILFSASLRKYILFMFALLGVYYLYTFGFLRPAIATKFGFFAKEQGIIFAVLTIITASVIRYIPFFRKHVSDIQGLIIMTVLMAIAFIFGGWPLGIWGIGIMLVIEVTGKLAYPWISIIVNKETPSKYRATTISTVTLFTKTPYIFLAIIGGSAVADGKLGEFNIAIGVILLFAMLMVLLTKIIFMRR